MAGQRIFDTLTLDGAPREAPAAFAQPKAEPLTEPAHEPGVEVSGVVVHPDEIRPPAVPGPALESLAPAEQAPRDPREPFESPSMLTGPRSREHDPHDPFEFPDDPVSSSPTTEFAPPDASSLVVPTAAGPGTAAAGQGAPSGRGTLDGAPPRGSAHLLILSDDGSAVPCTAGSLLRSTGIAVLVCLAIGFIIRPAAAAALILAWILSTTRSRSRMARFISIVIMLGFAASTVWLVLSDGLTFLDTFDSLARWLCLGLVLACPWITRSDLKRCGRLVSPEQAAALRAAGGTSSAPQGPGAQQPQWPAAPAPGPVAPVAPSPGTMPPRGAVPPNAQGPLPPYPGGPGGRGPTW